MAFTKSMDDLNIIQKLDDEPNDVSGLTAEQLKAKFDEAGNILQKSFNQHINELGDPGAAALIGARDKSGAISNVQKVIDENSEAENKRIDAIDERITTALLESGNVPTGGNAHQVLTKRSTADFDMEWAETKIYSADVIPASQRIKTSLALEENSKIDEAVDKAYGALGDCKITVRKDLGNNWELCDGRIVYDGMLDELKPKLLYTLKAAEEPRVNAKYYFHFSPQYGNEKILIYSPYSDYKTTAYVLNIKNGSLEIIYIPNDAVGYAAWNGNEWICVKNAGSRTIGIYKSQNPKGNDDWSLLKTLPISTTDGNNITQLNGDLVYDGYNYMFTCEVSGYINDRTCFISADFSTCTLNTLGTEQSARGFRYVENGLSLTTISSNTSVYKNGVSSNASPYPASYSYLVKCSDDGYVFSATDQATISVYSKSENKITNIPIKSIFSDFYTMEHEDTIYDEERDEIVLILDSNDSNNRRATIRIKRGDDPTNVNNYAASEVFDDDGLIGKYSKSGVVDSYYAFVNLGKGGVCARWFSYNGAAHLELQGAGIKSLPKISMEGAYCYIKAKEG